MAKRRVSYYYDGEIGNYYYGPGHPMKPHRIRMTHNLLVSYDMFDHMEVFQPRKLTHTEMARFHTDDYLNFLRLVSPDNMNDFMSQLHRFNVGEDCPVFDGMYEFCQLSAGGSVGGAVQLNTGEADIVVNWSGGLHHAKKSEASGFCYVNDIVLAILELLKVHDRVLYIDIDIHHGDGVEEAFYTTDRVMCVSFHKYGDFFPGTGDLRDVGTDRGKYYSVNFPLRDGIDDFNYELCFTPVISKIMETFRPSAVVMQCGADSLSGDRLGCFNLSVKGHARTVEFVKSFGLPTLVLGGGGYTIRNVARCWSYETAVLLEKDIPDELPYNEYLEYFGPDYRLHYSPNNMENTNSREYLETCKMRIFENLRHLPPAPSVPISAPAPNPLMMFDDEPETDPDIRISQRDRDRHVEHPAEMESEFRSDPTARDASIEPDQPSFAPERETSEQSEMDVEESPSVPASEVEMQAEPNQEPAGAPEAPAFAAKDHMHAPSIAMESSSAANAQEPATAFEAPVGEAMEVTQHTSHEATLDDPAATDAGGDEGGADDMEVEEEESGSVVQQAPIEEQTNATGGFSFAQHSVGSAAQAEDTETATESASAPVVGTGDAPVVAMSDGAPFEQGKPAEPIADLGGALSEEGKNEAHPEVAE